MKDNSLKFYLFEEHINTLKEIYPDYNHNFSKQFENYLKFSKFLKMVDKFLKSYFKLLKIFKFKEGRNFILFYDQLFKYSSILHETSKNNNIALFGTWFNPFFYSLRHNIPYYPIHEFHTDLYDAFYQDDNEKIKKSVLNLKNTFKSLNPDMIVLNHDHYPETRAVVMVAKELGIPTIEIQHGIYQKNTSLITGKYVDYVFVWGNYFRELYKSKGFQNKFKVLGYPYDLLHSKTSCKNMIVYYYGQPYEKYYYAFLDNKINTILFLNDICIYLGFKFIYRPHPSEDSHFLKSKMQDVNINAEETLEDSLSNGTIFISFNSTALIEAAIRSKICVQLNNFDIETDNFEELGICKTVNSLYEIKKFLEKIKNSDEITDFYQPMEQNYIEIPSPNPGKKFLEIIGKII